MDYPATDSQPAQQSADTAVPPSEWWEWALILVPLMSAIGAIGVYFIPTHPEITLYVMVLAFLFLALALFLGWQMWQELRLSRYQTVELKPDGTPVVRRHKGYFVPVMVLIILVAVLASLSVLGMMSSDSIKVEAPFSYFATEFALGLIVALLWYLDRRGTGGFLDEILGRYRLLAFCLILALGFYIQDWSDLIAPTNGPAAPWQAQLQFAQQEADRIADGSVLTNIRATDQVLGRYYEPVYPLVVIFIFEYPSGAEAYVHILDTDPPRMLGISKTPGEVVPLSDDEKKRFAAEFATVKLSPRLIVQAAESRSKQLKIVKPGIYGIFMQLEPGVKVVQNRADTPTWGILYGFDYYFALDPTTGEVLDSRNILDHSDSVPPPAPTPPK